MSVRVRLYDIIEGDVSLECLLSRRNKWMRVKEGFRWVRVDGGMLDWE
jgi:hypothetical protein